MISTKSFEKGQQLTKNFCFFEIPYLGRGTAFYTCFSIDTHFSCVTTGTQLFLGLSMLLAPQTSVPFMSFLLNWLLTPNHPLGHVWCSLSFSCLGKPRQNFFGPARLLKNVCFKRLEDTSEIKVKLRRGCSPYVNCFEEKPPCPLVCFTLTQKT